MRFQNNRKAAVRTAAFFGLIMFASLAGAITKVGGYSIVSPDNGFELLRSELFYEAQQVNDDRVRFVGPVSVGRGGFQQQLLYLDAFANLYPTLVGLGRQEMVQQFLDRGWIPVAIDEPCAIAFRKSSETGIGFVSTWGAGRGLYMVVTNTRDGMQELNRMVASLKINRELCGW